MTQTRQLCTFSIDQHLFGIDVLDVQEIIRQQETTRVPLASPMIHGLINLRGQIVTVIDLRQRLGLPPRANSAPPINVVVRSDDGATSLLVDEIGDMLNVEAESFETPPETVRGPVRDLMSGVCKLDGRLLLVLDTAKTVDLGGDAQD